jgi:hypothetical protein
MIALSEFRNLGGWVHEFGHSLTSKYPNPSGGYRITDRYNYAKAVSPQKQYGTCNMWDVMGSGSHWGADDGGTPVQMSSFTKSAAGWLGYSYASEGNSYALTALEGMKQGDSALRIDNPDSGDPEDFMIIEARDSGAPYGAPASGVELYDVYWDYSYNHHVVNALETQSGPTQVNSADGDYSTPTMYATDPSNGSTYTDPDWGLKFKVTATAANPYTATVKIENYTPANLVGVQMHPGPVPVTGPIDPGTTTENALDGTLPDMDLHAYDDQGDHVGMNYQTGQYENNIPGAIASGNLVGGTEWIYVPSGTHVRYEISTYRTQQFLAANPQLAANATPQNYNATAVKFDSQGVRYVADLGKGSADAGAKVPLNDPVDPSLNYQKKPLLGVGNNSSRLCPLLPAFLVFLLGGFLWKKRGRR